MNYFLTNPIPTAAQAMRGFEKGGEVDFDEAGLSDLVDRYGIADENASLPFGYADGGEVDDSEDRVYAPRGESAPISPLATAATYQSKPTTSTSALAAGAIPSSIQNYALYAGKMPSSVTDLTKFGSAGADLESGNLYEKLRADAIASHEQKLNTLSKLGMLNPETKQSLDNNLQSVLSSMSELESEYVSTLPQRKELSNLLSQNKFEEAYEYAMDNDLQRLLLDPTELSNLRSPFSKEESREFISKMPPSFFTSAYGEDPSGENWRFDPKGAEARGAMSWVSQGPEGAVASESGFPDLVKAAKTPENLKGSGNLFGKALKAAAIIAAIYTGGAALGAWGGGAGAAGAAGAGAAGTTAGTATSGGFLTGLKTAATKVLGIPQEIGKAVAGALGYSVEPVTAKMIGNALISGGVTGAKGGDLEDVLKSAALAAGLTYVSDKAISTVAQKLQDSRIAQDALTAANVATKDPALAANIASNITQGLENFAGEIGITAFAPSAAAAGLQSVGALTAAQAATSPAKAAQQAAPEEQFAPEKDLLAGDITISTDGYDFGAGLETGAYTGYKLASDMRVGAEPEVGYATPEEIEAGEIEVSAEGDQADFTGPLTQVAAGQLPIEREAGFATPEEIAAGEIGVSTEGQQLDLTDPLTQAVASQLPIEREPGFATPEEIAAGEIGVSTEGQQLDLANPVVQAIMNQMPFEPAPIDPLTGLQEVVSTTAPEGLDVTDPLAQVLLNRYIDVKPPEPVADDLEEFKIETERDLSPGILQYAPPLPIPINPADIMKDYQPTQIKSKFEELLSKYGTAENLLKAASLIGAAGGVKKPTTGPSVAAYDPRAGAAAGQWIDWEKVKADAAAAGMNLNTYVARNWNKIQNRALETGVVQPSAPAEPQYGPEYNPEYNIMDILDQYGPVPKAYGGVMGYEDGGRYVDGPGSGRDDKIPALLSDGEYVIDAETLALLGDGSTKEGARKMDEFRSSIRKHKGTALAKGGISPNAKSPLQYLRKV